MINIFENPMYSNVMVAENTVTPSSLWFEFLPFEDNEFDIYEIEK